MKRYLCRLSCLWILMVLPLSAATSLIYVPNTGGTTISVIDPATNKVVQVIENIEAPEEAKFSPDGSRVYIDSGGENVLYVVDRKTGKHLKKVPLSGYPNDLAVTNDGRYVLVCIFQSPGGLDIIDTISLEKVETIPMNGDMHTINLTADGKYAVVSTSDVGKFAAVFDLRSHQIVWKKNMGAGIQPFAIESGPDGSGRRIFML
jgi:YVTN family beta-propeller protein